MALRLSPLIVVAVCAALVAVAGCGWAQEAGSSTKSGGQPSDGEMGDLANELFVDDLEPEPAETTSADGLPPEVGSPKIDELVSRIAELETEVDSLRATIAALNDRLVDLVDPSELSRQALGAMEENPQLRSGLGRMLQGKVRLTNDTGEPQVMHINGTAWTVVTGESYVFAPVGTVSFHREGAGEPVFMGIQEWQENPETGQLELEFDVLAGGEPNEQSVLKSLSER